MTKDGWGSEWPEIEINVPVINLDRVKDIAAIKQAEMKNWIAEAGHDHTPWPDDPFAWPKAIELTASKLPSARATFWPKEATANSATLHKQGSNLVDDQAYVYFQCEGCNEILDPHTKSFAKLQEARAKSGWHVKWNLTGMGYKVYCAKCGEKV